MRGAALLFFAGCAGGLPAEDVSNLENASRTTAAAYKYQDADTPAASLIRASHCSVQAVIRNEKLDAFDSGIPCQ
jgi:hypothetical protein